MLRKLEIKDNFGLIIIAMTALILLILKLIVISKPLVIVSTFLFELFIYILIIIITNYIYGYNKIISRIIFILLYLVHTITSFIGTYFINDILTRRLSLSAITFGEFNFFITRMITIKYLAIILLILIGLVVIIKIIIAFKKNIKVITFKISPLLLIVFLLLGLIIVSISFGKNFNNLYVNTLQEFYNSKTQPTFNGDLTCFPQKINVDRSDFNYGDMSLKYKKIFVFVMESVIADDFNLKSLVENKNNFFTKNKANSNYFDNYYTNNLDSIPSIMTMLSGKFIPNEAYSIDSNYSLCSDSITKNYNLVDFFNDHNYITKFYVSNDPSPCELGQYKWKNIIDLKNKIAAVDKKYLCFNPYSYDDGCEDAVFSEDLINDLKSNENRFIMQEFIYVHNLKYEEVTKKSNLEYYSDFLNNFWDTAKKLGLDENVLIVIVSDHGKRDYDKFIEPIGYKIPLIFVANDLQYNKNTNLLSHLAFKDILFYYLIGQKYVDLNEIFVIGTTASNIFGYISINSGALFLDNGDDFALVSKLRDYNSEDISCEIGKIKNYKKEYNSN